MENVIFSCCKVLIELWKPKMKMDWNSAVQLKRWEITREWYRVVYDDDGRSWLCCGNVWHYFVWVMCLPMSDTICITFLIGLDFITIDAAKWQTIWCPFLCLQSYMFIYDDVFVWLLCQGYLFGGHMAAVKFWCIWGVGSFIVYFF